MAVLALPVSVCALQPETRIAMAELVRHPVFRGMTIRAVRAELVEVRFNVTACAFTSQTGKLSFYLVAILADGLRVRAFQPEPGYFVEKVLRPPVFRAVTTIAVLAELSFVFVVLFVAGQASVVQRFPFLFNMALLAFGFFVFAYKNEPALPVVVEDKFFKSFGCMAAIALLSLELTAVDVAALFRVVTAGRIARFGFNRFEMPDAGKYAFPVTLFAL